MKRLSLVAAKADAGERLDRFLAARGGISRGLARRAIDAGGVFLEGQRCKVASRKVWPDQKVTANLEEGGRDAAPAASLDRSRLLYADADLAAVDKPAGVPAQPTLTTDRGAGWRYDLHLVTEDGRVRTLSYDAVTLSLLSVDGEPVE